jgi:flagellar hook assembly protein FlgD
VTTQRLRVGTFALLVVATFAAFFVVQRIKREPPDVRRAILTPLFSPNGDGRLERASASFVLRRADTVSVRVIDGRGNVVRTLLADRRARAAKRLVVRWNGRTASGRPAPDGIYRYRVNLQDQGRAVLLPRGVRIDTAAPRPRVQRIGGDNRLPDILPRSDRKPLTIRFYNPSRSSPTEVLVYRTQPDPQLVHRETVPAGRRSTTWDGKDAAGAGLPAGTYVVALRTRDLAGNVGTSPSRLPPRPGYGETLPRHAGITIRYLAAQSTLEPAIAGAPVEFGVDARQRTFAWSVRRVGVGDPVREGRPRTGPVVKIDAPDVDGSGLYLFEAHTRQRTTTVPAPVQSVHSQKVLVVLPAIAWQGTNPVDDDDDGWPNTLTDGLPVLQERVFPDGLPEDLVQRVAPLLIFLDRSGLRYDLTTDLALAQGVGPRLAGHTGVLLAGDERWLPADTQRSLVRFVRRGGKLASFGVDSLRRQVRLTRSQIVQPTAPDATDAFGATLRPLQRQPDTTLTIFDDQIDLFAGDVFGGTGVFSGFDAFQETVAVGAGAKVVASAVTDDGEKAIVAERLGGGLVIRLGLPQLPQRLSRPGNETELVRRTWTLLSH